MTKKDINIEYIGEQLRRTELLLEITRKIAGLKTLEEILWSLIDFVTEKSELKIGRYTPGQHIPVVSDNKLIEKEIDYALILAWNFSSEIMSNLKDYRDRGGKFIIPIPHPKIL